MSQSNSKLTIDEYTISHYEYSKNSGPYVLLLHGWEGNAGNMEAFVQPLIEQGFNIIAPNAPAHYSSSGSQCTLRDYQQIIVGIIQRFNPEIILSHSFGTAAAMLAMREVRPLQIQKFISISAPDRMLDIVTAFTRFLGLSKTQEFAFLSFIEEQLDLSFEEAEVHTILSALSVDTLIIHDENDTIISVDNAYRVAKANHRSRLFITKGYGHYRILWNQDLINTVTNFLLETKEQLADYS
ncbi:alpha/beta fold hydrolase [Balneola sp. MJW-20]|uniref:alpha/beta fold hydrolase n=1 Tax=Gracilimonas aurantiaca TaxID=3234185 RepID=UPI003466C93E